MSWRYRRSEARHAQRDADRLDALVSDHGAHGPGAAAFRRELAAARAVAAAIHPVAEPPEAARVALRAGLSMQRTPARRGVSRAGFALVSMAAAAASILVITLSSHSERPPTNVEQSLHSLDILNRSVHSLEAAVATGDQAVITQRLATAQAAVQAAQSQAAALPAASRALALTVTSRSSDEIQWLATHGPVTQTGVGPTTASPSTTQHVTGSTTSTTPRRSTTTTSSSTTTTPSSTTTTTPRATTTTEGPTTTTPAPPTTAAGAHAAGEPPTTAP